MPTFSAHDLRDLGARILRAAGVPAGEADIVAAELAEANLVGHDSHGVMRLVQYVQMIQEGYVRPGAPLKTVVDAPGYAVIDAHFALGQVAAHAALEIGLSKVRATGTATVMIRNCNHVGRLGSYMERAAREGCLGLMAVNSPGPGGVAPFGGIERRLGTNPICMAAPWGDSALVLDMTTSATAEGKLRVAFQKGEMVGEGLMIDGEGRPTINPADYYNKPYGAILSLGGSMGHKGFGLAVMLDVFCGILSGAGVGRADLPRGANGVWLHLLDIERFLPRAAYDAAVLQYVHYLKDCRLQPGFTQILMPGEIELARRTEREASGIPIPDEMWRLLSECETALNATRS